MARTGGAGEAEAANLLFTLQSDRDASAGSFWGNTGAALIDEIMLERRKELYGEGGPDYIDNRRLGLGFTRGRQSYYSNIFSKRRSQGITNPIPQTEIDSNPEINEGDQNP